MVMFELTLFPLAFVMLPDISLDLCMSPFHFNFHLVFAWHFTWSLHFKMGFAIHLELYLVFHLIFSHRMMTFLILTWDFICRDPALPWLLHGWVFPLVEGQTPKAEDDEESFQEAFFSIYLFIFYVYIYIYAFMSQEWWCCKLTVLVQTFTWPTFHLTKYSLDGPFTEASNHLTNLFHLTRFALDWPFTWPSLHLIQLSLDRLFAWQTPFTWHTGSLTILSLENHFTWFFSHLNHSWSVFFSLDLFTCTHIGPVHL